MNINIAAFKVNEKSINTGSIYDRLGSLFALCQLKDYVKNGLIPFVNFIYLYIFHWNNSFCPV